MANRHCLVCERGITLSRRGLCKACHRRDASQGTFTRRPWTSSEIETLRRLTREGYEDEEIADELDRTVPAVAHKRSQMRLLKYEVGNDSRKHSVFSE